MIVTAEVNSNAYRKFLTAISWFNADENAVIERFMDSYCNLFVEDFNESLVSNSAIGSVSTKENPDSNQSEKESDGKSITEAMENRKQFVCWFSRQKNKNKKFYTKKTVGIYAQKLANVLRREPFAELPIENIFEISNLDDLERLEPKIEEIFQSESNDLSPHTHEVFHSAMRKYAEFLSWKERN